MILPNVALFLVVIILPLSHGTHTKYPPNMVEEYTPDDPYFIEERDDNSPNEVDYEKSRQLRLSGIPNLPLPLYFLNQNKNRKNSNKKRMKESSIYYIRLPASPYVIVPGLGYVSQPPTISPLLGIAPDQAAKPVDFKDGFVSDDGYDDYLLDRREKPVKVMNKKKMVKNSKIERIRGLFYFNGRPEKVIILPVDE